MLAIATITYDLSDYGLADFDSRRTKVWATNNVNGPVVDTEGNLIHLGSANGTVNADGTGSITVPTPGTGSNPASWQTTIHVDYPDRNADRGRGRLSLGPFTITVNADLADLVTQMEIPPETLGGDAWLATIDADDSSQYRVQQDARLAATIATEFTDRADVDYVTPATADAAYAPLSPVNLATLPAFSIIAHRGGALVAPEESMEAYRTALAAGADIIEVDLHQLADGSLAVMHDTTVDRTTTGTGNVADHTAYSWKMLSLDPSTYLGGNWSDGAAPLLFTEVLAEFGNRVLLLAEIKSPVAAQTAANLAQTFGISPNALLMQSGSLTDCQAVVAAGYPAMWVGTVASVPIATAAANGIDYVAVADPTAPYCTAAHAAGIKVFTYTVNRRDTIAAQQALGTDGTFTDDPTYLIETADRLTDPFALQTWYPGMVPGLAYGTAGTLVNRGRFWTPDYWGFDTAPDSVSNHYVLQGYLAVANPAAFTLDFKVRFDAYFGGDLARWASIAVMATDAAYTGATAPTNDGYQILLRGNGGLDIFRKAPGAAAVNIATLAAASGTDPVVGADTPFRLTVTATQVKIERTDVAESATATNSAMRSGANIHLGRAGAACRFKDLVVA